MRITPQSSTLKSFTPSIRIPLKAGNGTTVTVRVRKSVTSDGANYNGSQPRLMFAHNPLAGNLTETIAATAISSNGNWEKLIYVLPPVDNDCVCEFYVDCDGTTGWINVDDWRAHSNVDSRGCDFNSTMGTYVKSNYLLKSSNSII